MRWRRPSRDHNHATLEASCLRRGADTFDTSMIGGGFPDIVLIYPKPIGNKPGVVRLLEIKNRSSSHGRDARLSDSQSRLERRGWPIDVACDEDDLDILFAKWGKK